MYFHSVSAAPSGFDRIVVLERGSRYITVSWDPPAAPNGVLINYTILLDGDVITATPPDVLQYRVSPLLPFSMYTFSVMACTSAGCVESQETQSTTLEDGKSTINILSNIHEAVLVIKLVCIHTLFERR